MRDLVRFQAPCDEGLDGRSSSPQYRRGCVGICENQPLLEAQELHAVSREIDTEKKKVEPKLIDMCEVQIRAFSHAFVPKPCTGCMIVS